MVPDRNLLYEWAMMFKKKFYPSYESLLDWVLKNDSETEKVWDPPLNSDEIKIISDSDFEVETEPNSDNRVCKLKGLREILKYVKETREKNTSISRVASLLKKIVFLKEAQKKELENENDYFLALLKCCEYSARDLLDELEYKLLKIIVKNLSLINIQDWAVWHDPIVHLESRAEICFPKESSSKKWIKKKEYFKTFRERLIEIKKEDVIKNPQNWRIGKTIDFKFSESVFVVRKDNEEDWLSQANFTTEEWRKVISANSPTAVFWISIIVIVSFLFLFLYFFWWRKKRKSN